MRKSAAVPAETPQGKTKSGVRIKAQSDHARRIQFTLELNGTTKERRRRVRHLTTRHTRTYTHTQSAKTQPCHSAVVIITFCVSSRRRKMYCGHKRLCVCLCVCLSVCLSAAVRPHYCTDLDVTWRRGRGCHLVVHYWADMQSVHGLRCYGTITRTLVASLRPSRDMTT